jgi:hypothetical protein
MEILRGELSRLLIDRLDGQTELVTGDHVTAIADGKDEATVSFANGADRTFDLIIVAEGAQSSTRDLIFGRGVPVRPVGLYMAWLAVPPQPHDTDWRRWYNAPGRRVATLRPGKTGSAAPADTKATLSFASNLPGLDSSRTRPSGSCSRRCSPTPAGRSPASWPRSTTAAGSSSVSPRFACGTGPPDVPRWPGIRLGTHPGDRHGYQPGPGRRLRPVSRTR